MASYKRDEWTKGDKLKLVKEWASIGMSDYEIADRMGIPMRAFYVWKKESNDFCKALKDGENLFFEKLWS